MTKNLLSKKQTNHFTIDETSSANNVDNNINKPINYLKLHYEDSIDIDKDT